MSDTKTALTNAEWRAEGVRRFGESIYEWKFRCPACGNTASPRDLDTAGGNGFWAPQECIGRVHVGLGGLPSVKQHCTFHASNEPRLDGVIEVETPKGVPLPTLPFADPEPVVPVRIDSLVPRVVDGELITVLHPHWYDGNPVTIVSLRLSAGDYVSVVFQLPGTSDRAAVDVPADFLVTPA